MVLAAALSLLAGLALTQLSSVPVAAQAPPSAPAKNAGLRIVMTSSATTWDAFRFNPLTGESWLVNTDNDPDWVWQKALDLEILPAGDYDIQAVSYVIDDDAREKIFRMNRKTGRTWSLVETTMNAVAEPADFSQAPVPKAGFRLLVTAAEISWDALRLNPETGETWDAHLNADGSFSWQKIADAEQLPIADYQIQESCYVVNNQGAAALFRIDRKSGRSWISNNGQWEAILESDGFSNSPLPRSGFRLVLATTPSSWAAYRFNPETGETWQPPVVGTQHVWQKNGEPAQLPSGDYDLQMVTWTSDNQAYDRALRIDRKTGHCWITNGNAWESIVEQNDFANGPAPRTGFRLLCSCSPESWYAVRYNPETGETWVPNEHGTQWVADRWSDAQQLPVSDYDEKMFSFDTTGDTADTENIYRMDRKSGRLWSYFDAKWQLLAEPDNAAIPPAPKAGFQFLFTATPIAGNAIRFNAETGETWTPTAESATVLQKFLDSQQLPADGYRLATASFLGADNTSRLTILRTDAITGQSWYAANGKWIAIAEPK